MKSHEITLLPSLGAVGRSDAPWGAVGNVCLYGSLPSRGSVIPRAAERSGVPAGRGFPPGRELWLRAACQSSRDVRDRRGRGIARDVIALLRCSASKS